MIQDLRISNFKCFKEVHLRDLGRFNVIVGRNGGGKTAFLEALFFLSSSGPELGLRIRRMRGLGDTVITAERGHFSSLWRDMFFDFDEESTITLDARGSDGNSRSLTVRYGPREGVTLPFGKGADDAPAQSAGIDFLYRTADGATTRCRPTLSGEGLVFGGPVETFPVILLSPVSREGPEHNGQRFSTLSKRGDQERIVSTIHEEFPFIEDLSVEYHEGTAMVHAKLRSMNERVPLPLVSDGINKMLSILLSVHHCSRSIVLIDEMENGLYFDLMAPASAAILDTARQADTQVFATTHSLEYLRALLPVAQQHPDDFRLLRTTKDNGASEIDMFDGRRFAAAIEEDIELR